MVNAPVAVTGFAISYAIDGANGQPYTTSKLTPLLLAKLLTESYPGRPLHPAGDPALANNPLNITQDPEFQALNPGITAAPSGRTEAASELMALSSDSDVIEALTTYINDDPTARAWLNGTPDQWGMVVNPAYKGIQLPVDQWPLLSTFEPTASTTRRPDNNDCLYNDPVRTCRWWPHRWPPSRTSASPCSTTCPTRRPCARSRSPDRHAGRSWSTAGRQTVGFRFMIGITPLADNERYGLQPPPCRPPRAPSWRPSNASLEAAASLLQPDAADAAPGPSPTPTSSRRPGRRPIRAPWSSTPPFPPPGCRPTDAKDYALAAPIHRHHRPDRRATGSASSRPATSR